MSLGDILPTSSSITKVLYPLKSNSNDISGNARNGTDSNITYAAAAIGNGSSSAISIPSATFPWGTNTMTLSFDFKINGDTDFALVGSQDSAGAKGLVIGYGAGGAGSAGKLLFYKGKSSYTDGGNAIRLNYTNDTKWHRATFVGDSSGIRAYIDSKLFGTGTNNTNFDDPLISTGRLLARIVNTTIQDYLNGSIKNYICETVAYTQAKIYKMNTHAKGKFVL